MSNGPTIVGIGTHGTDQPYKVFRKFLAGNAVAKGDVLQYSATADDGVTVVDAAASTLVACVAAEDAASGDYFLGQVKGFCDYITTDEGVTAGQALVPGAAVADSAAMASATVFTFGHALAADVGTVLSAAVIDCFGA